MLCRAAAAPCCQVITELGRRMTEAHPDYATYLGLLADALDLPLADFPAPPPQAPPAGPPLALHSLAAVAEGRPSATPSSLQPAPSRALGCVRMQPQGQGRQTGEIPCNASLPHCCQILPRLNPVQWDVPGTMVPQGQRAGVHRA